MLYENILQTIGNTPIVKLNKIGPKHANIYVKIESFNPMGSVKDRLAKNVIEQAEKDRSLKPGQTVVEANADAHTKTTAPEILESFADRKLDYWVSGFGTGGTLKGVSRVLKTASPDTKVVVCEPDNSPILGSGIRQERVSDGSPKDSHPLFRPHLMQGWSPDFIPQLAEDAVDSKLIDGIVPIDGNDALRLSRELAQKEGIFVGISAGATLAGAVAVAEKAAPGSNILCMLPDTGERYMSTPLFEDIAADMTVEEHEIARSTPNFRFDSPPPTPPAGAEKEAPLMVEEDARMFLHEVTSDTDQPVVMFSLEWCEFSWSVRKMLAHYEVPYRSIDLDSVAYQDGNRGGKIRAAIQEQTGLKTIPQIYIGGTHVGGATELFDAAKNGSMASLLKGSNVAWAESENRDPYSFLPGWLHAR